MAGCQGDCKGCRELMDIMGCRISGGTGSGSGVGGVRGQQGVFGWQGCRGLSISWGIRFQGESGWQWCRWCQDTSMACRGTGGS